jgi:uncharacterized protein (DUF1501 family)
MTVILPRRRFLQVSAAGAATFATSNLALARAATDRRFVFIIQRGAADGLALAPPVGDPAYAALRGALAESSGGGMKLDAMFALHPALTRVAGFYAQRQALVVHAVASPYRDRSHFDGQNVLETGGARPYALKDGWLNRLVGLLPRADGQAIAIAPTVPQALRGARPVASYAPSALPEPADDLLTRVTRLYDGDAQLGALWRAAMDTKNMAGEAGPKQDPASLGKLAAGFLVRADGPRIAVLETGGWDTHTGQAGRLTNQLRALDTLLGSLRDGLGESWSKTVVLVATEFGRTAAPNGTGGTDHGTGSAALLVGGAVKGGRVVADWPGLKTAALLEGRDLRPTADLFDVVSASVAEALALDPARVRATLFEGAPAGRFEGLIA